MKSILALSAVAAVNAAIAKDLVTSLPGISTLPSPQTYSGFLDIGSGKHLHYLFYTSQTGIQTDPLILWFNGGPGCSSLEGAFQESGPLWTTSGGAALQVNQYSFNNFSHQLFLEAPACVGFSYADATNPNGCTHNDTSTAQDNLAALQVWFAGFPEFAPNDFWISGESYAGIYVPSLAYDVVKYNAAGGKIKLKGIMVGNGCIGNAVGICGSAAYGQYLSVAQLHGHGFISDLSFNAMNAACGDYENPTATCSAAINTAGNEAGSDFDIYDIYSASYGVCNYGSRKGMPPTKRSPDATPTRPISSSWSDRLHRMGNTCTNDDDLTTYLNTAAVQTALHIPTQTTWNECGGISYTSDIVDERATIYPALQAAGLSILIYNGEADACVPITDNQWWTSSMNYTVAASWAPWTAVDGTLGGYVTEYAPAAGKFVFASIRGAGHMVPQTQPQYAWELTNKWVTGQSLT